MNTTQDKTPARPPELRARKFVLWAVASVLFIAGIWALFFQRSQMHMYVAIQATDLLKIEFLQPDRVSVDHCQLTANRVAKTMLSQCATCRLLVSRCLDKLDDRQEKILSGEPVEIPVMRTPTGAVAFISNTPELANEACRESERQASSGKLPVRCVAAGVASSAMSLPQTGGNADAVVIPTLSGTLGLILFAAVMSLVASYLVLRSRRSNPEAVLDVTSEIPALTDPSTWGVAQALKRCFDFVVAIFLMALLSPLFAWIAWRIWREDGLPIIHVQQRVGLNGKLFDFYKFRSMVHDAEAILERWKSEHPERWREYEDSNFKLRDDPRMTEFGKWLRSTSLDELPQLWNVLIGDMSLVGPRPILEREIPFYGDSIRIYSEVRPGITGMWQISGRSDSQFSDRVAFDNRYIRNWSLWVDIVILFKTVKVVLARSGAY